MVTIFVVTIFMVTILMVTILTVTILIHGDHLHGDHAHGDHPHGDHGDHPHGCGVTRLGFLGVLSLLLSWVFCRPRFLRARWKTPTVGLEPTTTRLRALRSAD